MKQLRQLELKESLNSSAINRNSAFLLFAVIIIYASVIRIVRAGYGLPYLYYIDEWSLVRVPLEMLENRNLNPSWMGFPAAITMYILMVLYAAITFVNFLFHLWITKDVTGLNEYIEITGENWNFNPVVYHYSGRCFMAFIAVSTIVVVFYFTRKRFGIWSAVLAALCLSVSPLYLDHSTKVRPDIFASFMILLSLVFFVNFFENREKSRYLILAGLFCGFSVSAKYPSAAVFLPLVVGAVVLDHQNTKIKFLAYLKSNFKFKTALSKICLFAFLGFFISTPYFFLDFSKALECLLREANPNRFGVSRLPGIQNYIWYLDAIVTGLGGVLILIVALIGLVKVFLEKKISYYLFFGFPILYFIFISSLHLRWGRWIIPILPFASISFGVGVIYIARGLGKVLGNREKIAISLAAIMLICIIFPIIKKNIHSTVTLTNPDTRTLSKEWVEQNIEEGSTIVCEVRSPQLWVNPLREFDLIRKNWDLVISEPLEAYQQIGVDYIILSCRHNEIYISQPDIYPQKSKRLQEISDKCLLIKQFQSTDKNVGPIIRIYQLPKNIDQSLSYRHNLNLTNCLLPNSLYVKATAIRPRDL